jgi:hypothetical protein
VLPSALVGLADLSSYRASLTVAFQGTEGGRQRAWTSASTLRVSRPSAARSLTIVVSGDLPPADPAWHVERDGVAYAPDAAEECAATATEPGGSSIDDPAARLSGVIGGVLAGRESVNGVDTDHVTFDERALGQTGTTHSQGSVWLAVNGGFVARYHLTTTGDAAIFGEGNSGTISWTYELTDANGDVAVPLPAGCPPGLVDAPMPADATDVRDAPGMLSFATGSKPADVVAFYAGRAAALGWRPSGMGAADESMAIATYATQGTSITVMAFAATAGGSEVRIVEDLA